MIEPSQNLNGEGVQLKSVKTKITESRLKPRSWGKSNTRLQCKINGRAIRAALRIKNHIFKLRKTIV